MPFPSALQALLASTLVSGVWTIIITVIQLAGVLGALHAIMHSRTPQAAIGWTLGLVLIPWISIPLYLIFGQSKFSGYLLAGHGHVAQLDLVKAAAKMAMEPYRTNFRREFQDLTHLSERLTGLPATDGNQVDLLIDGEQTFSAIFAALRRAEKCIITQFYIVHDDELGRRFQAELVAAGKRGVRVYLLYDEVGSKHLPPSYVQKLRQAGVEVAAFVTNRALGVRFQINFRNHRKLVVIDGIEGFTGGLNVGAEYMGRSARFGPWRDTHIHLRGPALLPLLVGFLEDWFYATGVLPNIPVQAPPVAGSQRVLSFVSGPADDVEIAPAIYLGAVRAARHRLWIASPYLVPDAATRTALQHAALRGIDVRILLPGMPDHTLPWLTSFAYYPALKLAGIRLYRSKKGFMHQKVLLVDHDVAMVGSINLDSRSFLLNFEHAALVCDSGFAFGVHQMLQRDFEAAQEVDLSLYERASFWFRLKVRLASLTSPEQ